MFSKKIVQLSTLTAAAFSSSVAYAAVTDYSALVTSAQSETDAGKPAIVAIGGFFVLLAIVLGVLRMLKRSGG